MKLQQWEKVTITELSTGSLRLLTELIVDGDMWQGMPLLPENISQADKGHLTDLKKKELLVVQNDEDYLSVPGGNNWVIFTRKGINVAIAAGIPEANSYVFEPEFGRVYEGVE